MGTELRVLVADDHRLIRELIEEALARDFIVIKGASVLNEVDEAFRRERIDVAVVDLSWRDEGSCLSRISGWKRLQPNCHLIILTAFDEWILCEGCLKEGATGFVVKTGDGLDDIRQAIREAEQGRRYVSTSVQRIPDVSSERTGPKLSRPKRRVLELLAEGYQQKQVARALGLKLRTVEDHTRALKAHFGVDGPTRVNWRAFMAERARLGPID